MQLKKGIDYRQLMHAIAACDGEVYCRTKEDNINMKSTLSQYVFLSVFNRPSFIAGAQIVCDNEKDYEKLEFFLEQ